MVIVSMISLAAFSRERKVSGASDSLSGSEATSLKVLSASLLTVEGSDIFPCLLVSCDSLIQGMIKLVEKALKSKVAIVLCTKDMEAQRKTFLFNHIAGNLHHIQE